MTRVARRRVWQDHFLAGHYSHDDSSDDPTVGIDYEGRIFQILGGKPGTPFGFGCWGTNTTTGYVQVPTQARLMMMVRIPGAPLEFWASRPALRVTA